MGNYIVHDFNKTLSSLKDKHFDIEKLIKSKESFNKLLEEIHKLNDENKKKLFEQIDITIKEKIENKEIIEEIKSIILNLEIKEKIYFLCKFVFDNKLIKYIDDLEKIDYIDNESKDNIINKEKNKIVNELIEKSIN